MSGAPELYCLVEAPKGSAATTFTAVDHGEVPWPGDYGHFPDTLAGRGQPLAAIICASHPGVAGASVGVRPVALLRVAASTGISELVLCVAAHDPSWASVGDAADLPPYLRSELERFLGGQPARRATGNPVAWGSAEEARTAIDAAAARWAATVNGHG